MMRLSWAEADTNKEVLRRIDIAENVLRGKEAWRTEHSQEESKVKEADEGSE